MTPFAYSWRVLYEAAKRERDRNRLPELIANARRRIQDRELDLVHIADDTREEEAELQAALRHLWALENETLDTRQYPE